MVPLTDSNVNDIGISLIYEPEDREAVVDIIFIHGLGGHPFNTWALKVPNEVKSATNSEADTKSLRRLLARARSKPRKLGPKNEKRPENYGLPHRQDVKTAVEINNTTSVGEGHWSQPREKPSLALTLPPLFWLRDLLPNDCPNARILTYGYDSRVAKGYGESVNQNSIFQHATDLLFALERKRKPGQPIIWVAHSLGGIIVKQVLKESDNAYGDAETGFSDIVVSTIGIVFIATPHQGSKDMVTLGELARKTATCCGIDNNALILRALGLRTPELEQCRIEFSRLWRKYNFIIKTFREGSGWKPLGIGKLNAKVVPDYSSMLGDAAEHVETLEGNHTEICRVRYPGDPNYVKISGQLKIMCDNVQLAQQKQSIVQITARRQACLASLRLPNMNARRNAIAAPVADTCTWLHKHIHYKAWSERHRSEGQNAFLWIKGKPGAGKSTILNYELKKLYTDSQRQHELTPAFFFGGKENPLHRTATGMYLSLVYQLVATDSALLDLLLQVWEDNNPDPYIEEEGATEFHWHVNVLKSFLEAAFEKRIVPPTAIFIDALDECENMVQTDIMSSEAREIVYFLDDLMSTAQTNDMILDVCVSSRSWFTMYTKNKCYEIIVDQCNQADLRTYTEFRFSARKNAIAEGLSNLTNDIVRLSAGIFLWVKLVVDMLLHDIDTGKPLSQLRVRLWSLPKGLESIFCELLVGSNMSEVDRQLTIKIFQWVIFSTKNLRLREWHHILPMIQDPPPRSLNEWSLSCEQDEQLIRRIRTLTMGLVDVSGSTIDYSMHDGPFDRSALHENVGQDEGSIEVGAGSLDPDTGETRTVQVIHESVRTFFLRDCFATLRKKRTLSAAIGESHLVIMETCLKFFKVAELDSLVETRERHRLKVKKISKSAHEPQNIPRTCPHILSDQLGGSHGSTKLSTALEQSERLVELEERVAKLEEIRLRTVDKRRREYALHAHPTFDLVSVRSFSSAGSSASGRCPATCSKAVFAVPNNFLTCFHVDKGTNGEGMNTFGPKRDHSGQSEHSQLQSLQLLTRCSPLQDNYARVQNYLAQLGKDNSLGGYEILDTEPQWAATNTVAQNINTLGKALRYPLITNSKRQSSMLSSNGDETFVYIHDALHRSQGSLVSTEGSTKSQQVGGDVLGLYHYAMDEVMVHAQLAQHHNANPRRVVSLFISMWKRFTLLQHEWEESPNLAEFCLRHDLVSWVEPILDLSNESKIAFDFFSSACVGDKKEVVELIIRRQIRIHSLSIHSGQVEELCSTQNLLFDIVQSQRVDLASHWFDCCTTLLSRGMVSNDQVREVLHKPDPLSGETVLAMACRMFCFSMVNTFLDLGADPNHIPRAGRHSMHVQMAPLGYLSTCSRVTDQKHRADFTATLLRVVNKGVNINSIDNEGNTPLHNLCKVQVPCTSAIRVLLDHGGDPSMRDRDDRTVLHLFCAKVAQGVLYDDQDCLAMLLSHRELSEMQDKKGDTALHLLACAAAGVDTTAEVSMLLKYGANPNICNDAGQTPLHVLCKSQNASKNGPPPSVLKEMLFKGAAPDITDGNRQTPLYYAVLNNFFELAELLIAHGADSSIPRIGNNPWKAMIRKIKMSPRSISERWVGILKVLIVARAARSLALESSSDSCPPEDESRNPSLSGIDSKQAHLV